MECHVKVSLRKEREYLESVDKVARETRGVDVRAHMKATALQTEVNARITEMLKECARCSERCSVNPYP